MRSICKKLPMDDHITSVLTTLSSLPVTRHTALYHVTLFLLIHGLREATSLMIYNCNNNKVEIFEDSPAPVTCGDITSTQKVVWQRAHGVNIGECKADGSCTSDLYNDFTLSRSPQSTESQLTLVTDYRRHAGLTVTCQDRASDSTTSCTIVIRRHSELSECHVTTNPVDGTVSGSCRVQQAFSSDNIYTCTWTRNDGVTWACGIEGLYSKQQPFGGFDASRELCSFTQALPQAGGLYTYSISVSPPATTTFSQQLRLDVEGPTDVIINEAHQAGINSSRVVTLSCSTTGVVYPGVNFTWSAGVCQNETHTARSSTCTVILDVKDDGKSVTCTAINSIDSGISVSTSVWLQMNDLKSVTSSTPVIIGVVVAVAGIAVIVAVAVTLILQRRRRLQADSGQVSLGSKDVVTDLHADETHRTDEDGYTNICITEVSATELPTSASERKDQTDMYENTQTHPDRTYDTTCKPFEEHKYSDLKVMTQGQSKVKATAKDLPDGEERGRDVYYNVS